MAGADLVQMADWLDPVATVLVGAAILVYIRVVIQPRLSDVEDTQDNREDRLDDAKMTRQELTLLVDDNAEHVDQVDDAVTRLKKRVRALEQAFAVHHGHRPRQRDGDGDDGQDVRPDGSRPVVDGDESPDDDGPDASFEDDDERPGGGLSTASKVAARRLKDRVDDIRDRRDYADTSPAPSNKPSPAGGDD